MHSSVQRVVTTCGFAFISRVEKEKPRYHMAPEEVYTRGEVFAGRKLSSMTVRIMFHVLRIHREGHGLCKSGARDESTCPLFFFRLLLCTARRTGSGCQLSATRTSVAGHGTDPPEVASPRSCVVLRERLLIGCTRV